MRLGSQTRTTIRLALRELWANKLRTALTCLGMVIGVGAVIALMIIGTGVSAQITSELRNFGNNLVVAFPGGPDARGRGNQRPFEMRDVRAVRAGTPGALDVAAQGQRGVTARNAGYKADTTLVGAEPAYLSIGLWEIAKGRSFFDGESSRSVCVLGQTVKDKLFGAGEAIGSRIRLDEVSCEVIGILKPKGNSLFAGDQDDRVFMPLGAFQRRIQGNDDIFQIQVSAATRMDTPRVINGVREALRQSRGLGVEEPDDFTVRNLEGLLQQAQNIFGLITLFVAAVAFISLIVGGIGIMNIMLVSVTERTREIGIRLAIGARERDVLMQFLTEAMILAVIGGLAGIVFGLLIGFTVTAIAGWPFIPSLTTIAGATLFSAMFGIVFGFFPARRAAKLNPIEALRYE
jgi:ABC-type antimicrobial peptide transport system permease subunit